jgi:predicted type IV restriction endonuclease
MVAPNAVLELVERFERNRAQYLNPTYNETEVRREFLDPLFTALGWDVDNTRGYDQAYKDVVHEDAIKIGLDTRSPDYSFRVGGQRKFFVEAKKPAVNLKNDPAPAYQLRRYAWSGKLPLSILTDFQEFVVYDCRVKPAASDKSSVARTLYVGCEQYEERWEEIADVFGKEAVYRGSFDSYAESTRAKKGTAEVDKAFLAEIEGWRDALARNIALRNPSLTQRELNYAVQATIDRIIFLRICEDRGIETYGRLQVLRKGEGTYGRLKALFHEADARYNSGLFHFNKEAGRASAADRLTLELTIDDKPLKDIAARLYYPESPYEFSVLPADNVGRCMSSFSAR